MFPSGASSPVPLDELDVLQNPPNKQSCRKTNHFLLGTRDGEANQGNIEMINGLRFFISVCRFSSDRRIL